LKVTILGALVDVNNKYDAWYYSNVKYSCDDGYSSHRLNLSIQSVSHVKRDNKMNNYPFDWTESMESLQKQGWSNIIMPGSRKFLNTNDEENILFFKPVVVPDNSSENKV
jgi:hypothetical protein